MKTRLSLFYYDLVRERCDDCGDEKFHFVPKATDPETSACVACGTDRQVVDLSETSIRRLVSEDREVSVVSS